MRRRFLIVVAVFLLPAGAAQATTFTVTKQSDTNDHACTATKCSLRDAVIASNAVAGPNVIKLKAGDYKLTLAGTNENVAATGDLDITKSVTINGAGARTTKIDANKIDRVFEVTGGASLSVSGVTVTGGAAVPVTMGGAATGGAVYDHGGGALKFTNAALIGNTAIATGGDTGGAITSDAPVTLTNTSASGNVAGGSSPSDSASGGVIDMQSSSPVTLTRVTAAGNHAGGLGASGVGGVVYAGSSPLTVTASTFSDNTAGGDGGDGTGGVLDAHDASVTGSTFRSNHAGGNGADGFGGVMYLTSASSLSDSVLTGNTAGGAGTAGPSALADGFGGAIDGGSPTLTDTTISNNVAGGGNANSDGFGGGIDSATTAVRSTFSNNIAGGGGATGFGGAVDGGASLTNSTVSGNSAGGGGGSSADGFGGGVDGDTTVIYSDVVGNTAFSGPSSYGGGIDGTTTSRGSIVANNTAINGSNCDGTVTSQGHNLENGTSCGFTGTGDLNATPMLGPLGSNGGLTPTLRLLPGSPGINQGDVSGCPATDQRGVTRPQGSACDIGSYEVAPPTAVVTVRAKVGRSHHASLVGSATNSDAVPGTVYFQYGTTVPFGLKSPALRLARHTGFLFGISVGKLMPGRVYHYRAVASNPDGMSFGASKTFKTPVAPRLSELKVKPHGFAPGAGATISYTDSESGTTTFTVLRHGKKLGSFRHKGGAGRNSFPFSGKVHGKLLAAGPYKLRAKARNAFGSASHAVLKGFKVL